MDRPHHRPKAWQAAQAVAALLVIGLPLTFIALGSHRPAWWMLGIMLLVALVWQGWRNGLKPARSAALGMAFGPLTLMLGLEFSRIGWGQARDLTVLAACGLFGVLSFTAIRAKPALATALLAWHLMLAAPIDAAKQPHPGGPLVQPLQMGLLAKRPTPEEAALFVEGGCFAGGLEPRWVVTWQSSTSTP